MLATSWSSHVTIQGAARCALGDRDRSCRARSDSGTRRGCEWCRCCAGGAPSSDAALVDVVAEEHDAVEVGGLLGHVAPGRVEARLVVLARPEGEGEHFRRLVDPGERAGDADVARLLAVLGHNPESVQIPGVGCEPGHQCVGCVAEAALCLDETTSDRGCEVGVVGRRVTSQTRSITSTVRGTSSAPGSPPGTTRVHSTTEVSSGSPEVTPRLNAAPARFGAVRGWATVVVVVSMVVVVDEPVVETAAGALVCVVLDGVELVVAEGAAVDGLPFEADGSSSLLQPAMTAAVPSTPAARKVRRGTVAPGGGADGRRAARSTESTEVTGARVTSAGWP